MRKTYLVTLAATVAAAASLMGVAAADASQVHGKPERYLLPSTATSAFPEGIARSGRHIFLGSATDGTIYRGVTSGEQLRPFIPAGANGLTQALGMKVDDRGRLFVAGGATGKVVVYDSRTGRHLATFATDTKGSTLNDIAIAPDGDIYITDSTQPTLYRIPAEQVTDTSPDEVRALQAWLPLSGTPVIYEKDNPLNVNVNGIVITRDGRYLVVADTNSKALYRITIRTRKVEQIDLSGAPVMGDGLVLTGRDLYAVDANTPPGNAVVRIRLDPDARTGRVLSRRTGPELKFPSTAVLDGDDLLVVNLQFNRLASGQAPDLPFDVVRVPRR
ncbi:SMP-30/gluconolactonase/LRE family protein [Streptomyces sp. NPDC001177]